MESDEAADAAVAASVMIPEGGFAEINSVLADGTPQFGITAVAFDGMEELMWMGNSGVREPNLLFTCVLQNLHCFQGPCDIVLQLLNAKIYIISSCTS